MQNTKEGIQLSNQMPIRTAGKEVLLNNVTDAMRRFQYHVDFQPIVEQTICRIRMIHVHNEPTKMRD